MTGSVRLRELFRRYPSVARLAARLYSFVPSNWRLGPGFFRWLAFYELSESWSRDQLVEYQLDRLKDLLSELRRKSPYYKEILKGTDIASIASIEEFSKRVPFLDRLTARVQMAQIRSRDSKSRRVTESCTSGTTGLALQFQNPAEDDSREAAAICHQWRQVGYDPVRSVRAEFRGLTKNASGVDISPHRNLIRCNILDMSYAAILRYAQAIKRYGVTYLHGYPSALTLLARNVLEYGIRFPQPRGILLASEIVYDWQLAIMQETFPEAKLFAHYGCAERTVLAGWCEFTTHYHVLPQYSIVEVDSSTREIVGTNLFNDINGFVRYRLTDTAIEPSVDMCPKCRRPYVPRFTAVGGRAEDYLFSRLNGWIPPAIVTYPFKKMHAIAETQIHQVDEGLLRILFTTTGRVDLRIVESEQEQIRQGFHRLMGDDLRIEFEEVAVIDRTSSGKYRWVVSHLERDWR